MGRPRKWDPTLVEREFVTSEHSIRELARRYDVAYSSMAKHARDSDWVGKRMAYKSALSRRGYEQMATEVARSDGIVREESVTVLRATLRAYAERLHNGQVTIGVKDAVDAVRTLAELLKEPEGVRDAAVRTIEGSARTLGDADILRRVGEAARRRIAANSVLEGPAGEDAERTRPN